ncbi:MAG: hypothetical protein AB1449_09330 [Chloroflexota bacterium]
MARGSGCLGALAKGAAAILAGVLALTLPISLAAHDLGRVLFSPTVMTQRIVSRVVDSGQLRRLVIGQLLARGTPEQGASEGFDFAQATAYLEPAEFDALADAIFPPGWAADQLASVIDNLYAWLDNDQLYPELTLDLQPVVMRLRGGGAKRVVETLVDSWPACSVEQVDQMASEAATTGLVSVLYCEPPEPYRSALIDYAVAGLTEQLGSVPPSLRLGGEVGELSRTNADQIMTLKERIRLARLLLTWGWILPLSLLGLIMALVVRSYRGLTRWWGIPLLIGGLLTFAVLVVGNALARQALASLPQEQGLELVTRLAVDVASGLLAEVRTRLFWHASLATLVALGLLVSGAFVRKRPSPAAEAPGGAPPTDATG